MSVKGSGGAAVLTRCLAAFLEGAHPSGNEKPLSTQNRRVFYLLQEFISHEAHIPAYGLRGLSLHPDNKYFSSSSDLLKQSSTSKLFSVSPFFTSPAPDSSHMPWNE